MQAGHGSSSGAVKKLVLRKFLCCALTGILVVALTGCLSSTRNNIAKNGIADSSDRKADSDKQNTSMKNPDPVQDKANLQKSPASESPSSDETRWDLLRRAAVSGGQTASKLKPKAEAAEIGKVHTFAWELLRKHQDVKAVKVCRAIKQGEWWITLYQDTGGAYELQQYVWDELKEEPEQFLVVKRVPHSQLRKHLSASESGRICEVFEPTDSMDSAQEKTPDKVPTRTKASEPEASQRTSARFPASEEANQRPAKPEAPAKRQDPSPAPPAAKKPVPAQSVAPNQEALRKGAGGSSGLAKSEKPVEASRADHKPVSPFKKASLAVDAERGDTTEKTKPPLQAKSPDQLRDRPSYYVFVYGSSMNHSELMNWLDENGYDESQIIDAAPSKLEGYDFVWNYFSPSRGGGTVNLEPKPSSHVYGLLLEIEDSLLKGFDSKEGHPKYYVRKDQRVRVKRLEDGKTVFAWLYVANPNKGGKRDVWPTAEYKQKILQAASFWGLPENYIARIKAWPTR